MVIAYDVTSKKTFGNVDKWKEKVEERNEDNLEDLVTVLVGCKADLGDIREVGGFYSYAPRWEEVQNCMKEDDIVLMNVDLSFDFRRSLKKQEKLRPSRWDPDG